MTQFVLRILPLGLILVIASGCTGPNIPHQLWHSYKTYQTHEHFRAMACVEGSYQGGCVRTWQYPTAKQAAESALNGCNEAQFTEAQRMRCSLRFVGNIDVFGMSPAEIERAIEQYQKNTDATN